VPPQSAQPVRSLAPSTGYRTMAGTEFRTGELSRGVSHQRFARRGADDQVG